MNAVADADAVAEEDQWLDEVLSQTFPASDPVPLRRREAATSAAPAASMCTSEKLLNSSIP
jgi:hypothetical protein